MVVGFWKRLLSDIIDAVILSLFGAFLCIPFSHFFYSIGTNGIWIGMVISFLYSGLFQSSLGEGQSLAKKILKIQVLRMDGKYLSLPMSFLRYSVVALIAYNASFGTIVEWLFPGSIVAEVVYGVFIFVVIFGCILMVPVHPLKRGLHDLIAGSIVVKKGTYKRALMKVEKKNPSRVQKAYAFWIIGMGVALICGVFMWQWMSKSFGADLGKLWVLQKNISEKTDLRMIQVNLSQTSSSSGTSRYLLVGGFLEKSKYDDETFCDQERAKVIQEILPDIANYPNIQGIRIVLRSGLFIGILSFNESKSADFTKEGKEINSSKKTAVNAST